VWCSGLRLGVLGRWAGCWRVVFGVMGSTTRLGPHLDELDLLRTLEMAAAALGGHDDPIVRSPRGSRVTPHRQRLAAVQSLMSASRNSPRYNDSLWLMRPRGGFRSRTAARGSITPVGEPGDYGAGPSL
jgi:hypothetical protein